MVMSFIKARIERHIADCTLDRAACLAVFSDMSRLILFKVRGFA
jgi:hypothetical protein